jgi:uncharacterized protein DUF262
MSEATTINVNHGELLTLKEIFNNGNRVFTIPDYQRGYSWEKKQRKDLLIDLQYVLEGNYRHFTGTIVATASDNSKDNFDIVDGQQRLTTILLLLNTIYWEIERNNNVNEYINSMQNNYLISDFGSGNSIRKFRLQTEPDSIFHNFIKGMPMKDIVASNKSSQNILDAIDEFKIWVGNQANLEDYVKVITEKLGFLLYTPKKDNEIGIMFEVINNRGKALSELEKVKNYLIYFADKNVVPDLKILINNKWSIILSNLNLIGYSSNADENNFLRYCWIVFKDDRKSESHNAYENMKKYYDINKRENWQELHEFVLFVEHASQTMGKILKQKDVTDNEEKKWLERISYHPVLASIIPLILAIYHKIEDQKQRIEFIKLVEKLNFRYYVLKVASRSDSGQGELYSLAFRFYNNQISIEELKSSLITFVQSNAGDKTFVEYLTLDSNEGFNYYDLQGLKFILASYEEHLRIEKGEGERILSAMLTKRNPDTPNDFFHREHIWAIKEYSHIDDSKELDMNKRRLANFILLKETENIKVGNKPIEEKINLYLEDTSPNTMMIRELNEFFETAKSTILQKRKKQTWKFWYELYQIFFDIREERIIEFALDRWHIDELTKQVSSVQINSNTSDNINYKISYVDEKVG